MPSLGGKTIAILESRRGNELAQLIANCGGIAYHAPALREAPTADLPQVGAFLDAMRDEPADIVIFQTGVGARALYDAADRLGRAEELVRLLDRPLVVARGPKPVAVLRSLGVRIDVRVPEPHTTVELLRVLEEVDLDGKLVALQQYGEANLALAEALRRRGARVRDVELYQWTLPDDLAPLERLIRDLPRGEIAAIAVTSQVQVRHLFEVAERLGLASTLREALIRQTVVAAVGPVAARALEERGVRVHVLPVHPKMGALVLDLARHFERDAGPPAIAPSHKQH